MTLFQTFGPARTGAFWMVLAGTLFAVINLLTQYATMMLAVPSARMAFWQYFIALLFSLPWVAREGLRALKTGNLLLHLIRVASAVIGVQLWIAGLAHVPIWQAIALIMLSPFFVTLGANLFLEEAATPERWLAVTVGFLGGMIILAPWSESFTPYVLYPVGAAAFWALTSLLTKRMTRSESPESLTVYLLLLLSPVNLALTLGEGVAPGGGLTTLILVAAGLLTALAQYAIARAYASADAAYLQPFDHLKLPLNVGFGILAFGFMPPGAMWLGSALILAASFYLLRQESRGALATA
ncbi:DMT family transporter [Celeribacter neptunius]|uniref:EamA-like transporter family protein n=1 Tax=Celeribacter neptunius TaxID=588602 RepID=A0A1I3WI11_9RHOB|nr:DMT family transporter [Celeribacter neptunius]SFK07168.1 EamA-like transporter family protein [Celeribacter neptunius]